MMRFVATAPLLAIVLAACAAPAPSTTEPPPIPSNAPTQPTATSVPATNRSQPPTATTIPPTATPDVLPPDPQRIEFNSEDGVPLVGYYYPAAVKPAPLVILSTGFTDQGQQDWADKGVVQWLQNRGGEQDTSLFPPLPADRSFAVFAFDVRGFGESTFVSDVGIGDWAIDARAGVQTAQGLPDVDASHFAIFTVNGGGEQAIAACADGCLGVFSLTPPDFLLDQPYSQYAAALDQAGKPVWCVDSNPGTSPNTCNSLSGDHVRSIVYPVEEFGLDLIQPGLDPDIGQILFDFLSLTFAIAPRLSPF